MSSRAKKFLLLVAATLLLAVNGILLPVLNRERAALGITRMEPLKNAPPVLALTTQVLGGFRGLIANALWIRATQLQENGKYFEMVQLADWITKLEPHIAQVWMVQSWNMAFNISVKFPDHADRWRWVQRGIELLRDDAIRYNPHHPLLYADLAWLYQFKMGNNMDDAHFYYKAAWAAEMMRLFGGPTPPFEQLIRPRTPEEQQRARLLRDVYKLDPARMLELDDRYGPLDWRLPEAHAVYWAAAGLEFAKGEDVRRLRWAIYQSMFLSYQRGYLVLQSNAPPRLMPNLNIVPKVDAAYQEQIADAAQNQAFLTNNMYRAYRNFLRDVPYQFFLIDRIPEAEQWMRYLKSKFPDAVPPGVSLAEYAVERAMDNVAGGQTKVTALVLGFIRRSYIAVIEGEPDAANANMAKANEIWNAHFQRTKGDQRTALAPMNDLKDQVLRELLDPRAGLNAEQRARLMTAVPRAAQLAAPPASPQP
jgi:hypothetical protein